MAELPAPILTICIALPLAAACAAALMKEQSRARGIAVGALGATLALLLFVLRKVLASGGGALSEPWKLPLFGASEPWLVADGLNAVPMALFAALALVTLIAAPRRDTNRIFLISVLTLTSSTLASYAAANLLVFLAGWIAPVLLFARGKMVRFVFAASALSLTAAVVLIGTAGGGLGMTSGAGGPWVFALLALAAILRERIFPFHRATVALFDGGPILVGALLVNSNLGAFLIARVAMPMFPGIAADALPWLGGLALFTALYTAVLAIAEREPRRLLAMVIVSQSSAILAGLATASHEGIAGALLQWIVLGVSSTVLIAVYRSVEARIDAPLGGNGFMGLASRMPRLAVFFAIGGLTMVGLPGTLGFPGEDLLLHGVLAGYGWWGAALPIAIALNAYHAFRLFARLFLGRDVITNNTSADALPRERWALSACLALLVWGGLVPRQVVSLQAPAVGALVHTAESTPDRHP
jgi:NADH-quinone oxidoreductase subunit M